MSTTSFSDCLQHYELPDCIETVEDYERYVKGVEFTRSLFPDPVYLNPHCSNCSWVFPTTDQYCPVCGFPRWVDKEDLS